uniref:DUF4573 domain-containing protein n=1 Tax=Shewanella algae TaxID=38313 RepID=UPI00374DBDB2
MPEKLCSRVFNSSVSQCARASALIDWLRRLWACCSAVCASLSRVFGLAIKVSGKSQGAPWGQRPEVDSFPEAKPLTPELFRQESLRAVSSQEPLRAVLSQEPLKAVSSQEPLKAVSSQEPLKAVLL